MRTSGIEVIGDTPWGTHLCLLYETRADLLEVVPFYLKAGLEGNELCIWVISPDVGRERAMAALAQAVPGLESHLQSHQLEVLPHSQVYVKDGAFDQEHAINQWQSRLDEALRQGFDGLRVSGDFLWVEQKDWAKLVAYEATIDSIIGNRPMLALCSYPLAQCSINDVFDIMENHGAGMVKRQGALRLIGDLERQHRIEGQLRQAEQRYRSTLDNMLEGCQIIGFDWRYLYVNDAVAKHGRRAKEELLGHTMMEMYPGIERTEVFAVLRRCLEQRVPHSMKTEFTFPDGTRGWFDLSIRPVPEGILILSQDITERENKEAELRRHNAELSSLLEASRAVAGSLDVDPVLDTIIQNVRRVIPAAEARAIALYDDKDGLLKTRLASGYEPGPASLMALRPGEAIVGKAFVSGEARLYATPQEVAEAQANISPENLALFLKATGGKRPNSSIAVPLKAEGNILGAIVLHTFGHQAFTPHHLKLAEAFANNAAIILSNAALHADLRRHYREVEALLEASRAVTGSLDIDDVLRAIMDSVRRVIPAAETWAIALYDDKDGLLKTRLASGYEPGPASLMALRPGESITGKAFVSGEARLYATPQEVAEAQANMSPENLALFLERTGGRRPNSSIAVPLKSGERTLGCVGLHSFGQNALSHHDLELAHAFANDAAIAISNATLHAEMEQRALTDSLTGLYNRGHFFDRLREEIARHSRDRRPLSVAMLDMNNFKDYNDSYGHLAGDRALQAIARALRAATRQSDIAFRYGGDEFALILVNTSAAAAKGVVDRIKAHVSSELSTSGIEATDSLSLDAGVAVLGKSGWDERQLVEAADKALYQSKVGDGTTVVA